MSEQGFPNLSQLLDVLDPEMQRKACGAASAAIVLGGVGLSQAPTVDQVLAKGLTMGAYVPGTGWLHRELSSVIRSYGIHAHPEDWSGDPEQYAWEHLVDTVKRHAVIASVSPAFSPSDSSHLIVVAAITDEGVKVYDPYRDNRNEVHYTVDTTFFQQSWTQRIICIHPALS